MKKEKIVDIEIPFFVYDKYSKQASFILLKANSSKNVEARKIASQLVYYN